jgi:NAD(P) transhydrogenase subunit alpha
MTGTALDAVDPFVFRLSIFVLAVFVGYYVVWAVTPALHTPLMSVTNAISSVIVDLAVERGGNVEGARPGEVAEINGVKIVGHLNMPGRIAASASNLYAKNLYAFLEILIDKKTRALAVNWDDELVKATALTRDGAVIHPNFRPKTAA